MMKSYLSVIFSLCLVLIVALPCIGGDLDDGISKFTDDPISKSDEIGKVDTNINYIVVDSIAKAKIKKDKDKDDKNTNFNNGKDDNNENSIVVGPGANVNGPVINVNVQK